MIQRYAAIFHLLWASLRSGTTSWVSLLRGHAASLRSVPSRPLHRVKLRMTNTTLQEVSPVLGPGPTHPFIRSTGRVISRLAYELSLSIS